MRITLTQNHGSLGSVIEHLSIEILLEQKRVSVLLVGLIRCNCILNLVFVIALQFCFFYVVSILYLVLLK